MSRNVSKSLRGLIAIGDHLFRRPEIMEMIISKVEEIRDSGQFPFVVVSDEGTKTATRHGLGECVNIVRAMVEDLGLDPDEHTYPDDGRGRATFQEAIRQGLTLIARPENKSRHGGLAFYEIPEKLLASTRIECSQFGLINGKCDPPAEPLLKRVKVSGHTKSLSGVYEIL